MKAPLLHRVLARPPDGEPHTPTGPAIGGDQTFVWQSRFGRMVIEVVGAQAYVNGKLVEPALPERG